MQSSILPEPPEQLKALSRQLSGLIQAEIREHGGISFARYMELALYAPGLGYYSAGLHKLGASGDFTTAPELGQLFAACVATQLSELSGQIGEMDILEVGAGTGSLAAGILSQLPADHLPRRYRILERSADLRAVQQETLERAVPALCERVEWLDQPPAESWQGALLANEVIDALAVERFEARADGIHQQCVNLEGEEFVWAHRPAPPDLQAAVDALGMEFAEGYCSEVRPDLPAWLSSVTAGMARGLALFFDYGYPRGEYYLPERRQGTFMCHYRHQAHDDVFFWPGLQDITAWVEFTALAEAADECELDVEGYASQAMFLLANDLDRHVLEQAEAAGDAAVNIHAEARQLTLPGMMGERFQVMGLGRGLEQPLRGFSLQDLRYRL